MNDFTAKPSSALVVAENKARRTSGCVGIFFKLFDWNRRFGKKKHFPKKLLAPARANQVSKKFIADEKLPMPKQMLIANGKGGVFSAEDENVKSGAICVHSEKRQDAKSPGLVARLMGLESMPLVEKSRSHDKSGNIDTKTSRFFGGLEPDKEVVVDLEKGCMRHELQPQKIQKTGASERRPVSRFGADALQIRNVLSRSRKRHPKLVSPVKSPRVARSSSRLIDAAARILEPGLQARRNRAKCSLTYSNAMVQPPNVDEVIGEERMTIDLPTQSGYKVCNPHGFKAQSSCRNCGHFTESLDLKSDGINETQLTMQNSFFQRVQEKKLRLRGKYSDKESQVVLLRSRYQPGQRETISPNDQSQWNFPNSSSFHPERDVSPTIALKHRVQALSKSQPQMLNSGDRVPSSSRRILSSRALNQPKDFIALNRNVSQSSVRFPRKPSIYTDVRRQHSVMKSDGLSTQKNLVRRNVSTCKQVESTSSSRLTMDRRRSIKSSVVTRNKVSVNSANPTFVRNRSRVEGGNGISQSKDMDVVSFTFNSPLKSKLINYSPTEVDNKEMDQSNFLKNDDIHWAKLVDEDTQREKSSDSLQIKEDAIGALLEQKLKELNLQADYESRTGIIPQGRTTASILQELIAALTAERPISPDLNQNLSSSTVVMDSTSQGKASAKHSSMRISGDRLSPGSVLDASFSNDSCVSSNRDDVSGNMFQSDDMDVSYDEPHLLHSDSDLFDCATSMITKENDNVSHLLDHITSLLQRANLSNMKLYPGYTNEVLLNAELLFGNGGRHPERFVDFLVGPFLDELETLAAAAWRSTVILGFDVSKGEKQNPLRNFLFDCLVECLDLRYSRYSECGFRDWCKLPTRMAMEDLVQVFDYEVRKWASLAMMSTDEVVDWEMSTSLGKWTDLDVEAFQSAAQMGELILQSLMDEVIAEFLW